MIAMKQILKLSSSATNVCKCLLSTLPRGNHSHFPTPLLYKLLPTDKPHLFKSQTDIKPLDNEKICPTILDRFMFKYECPVMSHNSILEKQKPLIGDRPIDERNQIEAKKQDLYWRRRRALRHRLERWRQLNKNLYQEALNVRARRRKRKHNAELRREWEKYGLQQAPPKLTEKQKIDFVKEWQEKKVWNEVMTADELWEFMRVEKVRRQTDKK